MAIDRPAVEPSQSGVPDPSSQSRNASARALLTNALSGYVILIGSALIGFVCTPILLHKLGATRFGIYSELGGVAAYLGLVELGLGTATTTRVAASEHSGPDAVAVVARTAILLFTIAGIAAATLSVGLTCLVPHFFRIPVSLRSDAQLSFLAIGLGQAVNSSMATWTALFLGTGRMYLVNLAGGLISMATSIATVVAAELGGSLLSLGVVQLVGAVLTLITFRSVARRTFHDINLTLRGGSRQVAKTLFRLGWRNAVSSVMATLAFGSDIVLVGLILTPTAAAAYAIALRGYSFLQMFVTSALGAFGPAHAHRAAVDDTDLAFEMLAASLLMTFALALLCGLPVAFYAHGLLHLWLGHVPGASAAIVRIFCAVLVLQCAGQASAVLMINFQRVGLVMVATTLSAAVNVTASVLLTTQVGVTGPALGSLIAAGLVDLTVLPFCACRILDHSVYKLARYSVLPLLVPTIALTAILAVSRLLGVSGLLILPVAGIAVVVDLAVLWFTPAVKRVRVRFTT